MNGDAGKRLGNRSGMLAGLLGNAPVFTPSYTQYIYSAQMNASVLRTRLNSTHRDQALPPGALDRIEFTLNPIFSRTEAKVFCNKVAKYRGFVLK